MAIAERGEELELELLELVVPLVRMQRGVGGRMRLLVVFLMLLNPNPLIFIDEAF